MANLKFKAVFIFTMLIVGLQFSFNAFAVEDKILCVVGDDSITQKDLNEFLALASLQLSAQYPDKKELAKKMEEIKKDALNQLIDERMVIQEAKRQKLKVDEKLVSERMEVIKSQYRSAQEFEQALIYEGLNISDAKKKLSQQLLMSEAVEENVRSKIFIHPKEVTQYYQEHSLEFALPQSVRVDSIFVAGEANSKSAQDKVNQAFRALKMGEEFSLAAGKFSDGPSLGIVRRGQLRKDIEDVIFNLKIGEFSRPVKTERGFFIFKLLEIIAPQERPLASVQNEVYRAVFQKKFEEKFKQWLESIKKDVYCIIK